MQSAHFVSTSVSNVSIATDPYSTSSADPTRLAADSHLDVVRNMLQEEVAPDGVTFEGRGPRFENLDGFVLNLENLLHECSAAPNKYWKQIIGNFSTILLATLDREFANNMSPDVAMASLRLRLFEDDNVNGWPIEGEPTSEEWTSAVELCTRPAFPGTRWALYLQRPGFGQNVRQQDLDAWGLSEADAFEHARNNVDREPPIRRLRRQYAWEVSGPKMFTHTRALMPELIERKAPLGWFVGIPNRSTVLVARARAGDADVDKLCGFMLETRQAWANSHYLMSRFTWYVGPEGPGRFGCDAEPVLFIDDRTDAEYSPDAEPELMVRFGPKLLHLWGEVHSSRPTPRSVL